MNIKVIASGSSGNCYKIDNGKTALLIECGIPIKKIKEACGFDFSDISGCLITHEHGDHCKAVRDVMAAGIDVYCSDGTADFLDLKGYFHFQVIHPDLELKIGSFKVRAFRVHHDAVEPFGYLITSTATNERLLFITDSYYTEYKFLNLTCIMIEANYSNDAIANAENKNRILRSHMSIENCIDMLKANDLSKVKQIYLLHLSSKNSDAAEFKRKVQEATGCEVHIA